jgi:lipid A 4'-phosphatase
VELIKRMAEPVKFPWRKAIRDFSVPILLLGFLTLLFRFTNLDIRLEQYFYSPQKGWLLQYKPVWDFFYRFGIFPGYLLAFCGLIMISVSYWNNKYLIFRKASLVLVFTIIVGPGILVNLVLKDHTGRPRPREITQFGGTEKFLCVCETGKTNEGKSFPCGHCSMGFYLAIPYLFYRKRKNILAYGILGTGIAYGILIGIARMMAGGHFASDVVWAGALTWIVALAGFYIFRPDLPIEIKEISDHLQKKRARRATLIIGILLPLITIGLMLATPYISSKYFDVTRGQLNLVHCKVIEVNLQDATLAFVPGDHFHLDYKVNAFGFPNSKIRGTLTFGDTIHYTIQNMGWFTEVKNVINLEYPANDTLNWIINVNDGKIVCNFPDSCCGEFHFSIARGDLIFKSLPTRYFMIGNPALISSGNQRRPTVFIKRPLHHSGILISFDVHDGSVIVE